MANRRIDDPQSRTDRATVTLPESVLDHIDAALRENGGRYNSKSEWVTKWCLIGVAAERGCLDAYRAELEKDHNALMAGVELARQAITRTPVMEAPAVKQFREAAPEVLMEKIVRGEPVVPKDVVVASGKQEMFHAFKGWHTKRGIPVENLGEYGGDIEDWLTGGRKPEFESLFGANIHAFVAEYEVYAAMGKTPVAESPAPVAVKPKHDATEAKVRALKERAKKVAMAYQSFFNSPVGSDERSHYKMKVVAYTKEAATLIELPGWGWGGFSDEVLSVLAERLGGVSEGDGKWAEIRKAIQTDILMHSMEKA